MADLVYKEERYKIIGACFEVYKQKGCGFSEPVYQECLAIEFTIHEIPFVRHPRILMDYKGTTLTQYFELDFLCFDKIIVELKSVKSLIDEHRAQTLNYLNATTSSWHCWLISGIIRNWNMNVLLIAGIIGPWATK